TLSREFAREHSDRLWKQLVMPPAEASAGDASLLREGIVAFALAVAAAVLIKVPVLFGFGLDSHAEFYLHNVPFFVLPLVAGFFVWKRQLPVHTVRWLAAGFVAGIAVMNAYPFVTGGSTELLAALHLPIALW